MKKYFLKFTKHQSNFKILLIIFFTSLLYISIYIIFTPSVQAISDLKIKSTNLGPKLLDTTFLRENIKKLSKVSTPSSQTQFTNLKPIIPFTFTLSDVSTDFGILAPNQLHIQTNTVTISAGDSQGFSLSLIQNHPLKLKNSSTAIAAANCDQPCSTLQAAPWNSTNSYGYGYSLQPSLFQPFADASKGDNPSIIFSTIKPLLNQKITITYQLNIPPTQATGDYQNQIKYFSLPTY